MPGRGLGDGSTRDEGRFAGGRKGGMLVERI